MSRIGVFGWGVVAPKSSNIDSFAANLASAETWLTPFNGFGPDNFLVGAPEFDFAAYRPWIEARYAPSRYRQLTEKLGTPTLYTIAAWIQALGQNPAPGAAVSTPSPTALAGRYQEKRLFVKRCLGESSK